MGGDQVLLATAGYDHTIRFWQAHNGVCMRTVQHPDSQVNAMDITPDRVLLAAAGYQHIRMYDIPSGNPNPLVNYDGVSRNVTAVGFQEDGKWMYTGGEDRSVRIWDMRSKNLQCQHIFQVNSPVNTVALHPNQAQLIVGDQSGAIYMWDLKSNHNEQLIPETDAVIQSVAIDRDGLFMAAVNNRGLCYVWSLSGGTDGEPTVFFPKHRIQAHAKYGLKCMFSPDSTMLATGSGDGTLKLWSTADARPIKTLSDPAQRWVWDCAFSEDSHYVITASSDNVGRLWSVEKGEVIREYTGHQKSICCLAFKDVKS